MMSPLAKELGRGGSSLSSPRGALNTSSSSPRSRRFRGVNQVMEAFNDDNGEKELLFRRSAKMTPAVLPQVDLSEHYSMCLKLSAENKINIKNAFNLCLIDFMVDELFKQQDVDFNLAAYSLDASSKIYACRIDALHSKVFKCMNALTMKGSGKNDDKEDDRGVVEGADGVDEEDNQEAQEAAARKLKEKKAKKRKKKKTRLTEGDTKTITFDLDSISCQQIDPLFDKVMQIVKVSCSNNLFLSTILPLNDTHRPIFACDDPIHTSCGGGEGGLNHNNNRNLGVVNNGDGVEMDGVGGSLGVEVVNSGGDGVLNSRGVGGGCLQGCRMGGEGGDAAGGEGGDAAVGEVVHEIGCAIASRKNKKTVNIERFKETLVGCVEDETKMICPTFRSFEFDNEDATTLDEFKKHRFDGSTDHNMSDDDDHYHDPLDGADYDHEEALFDRDISGILPNLSMQDKSNLLNSKNSSRLNFQQLNRTINSIKEGDMSSLMAALIRGKDGDACFKEDFLKIWSGPNLWKEKVVKFAHAGVGVAAQNRAPRTRKPKESIILTFDDDVVNNVEEEEEDDGGKKNKKKRKKIEPVIGSMEWHFQSNKMMTLRISEMVQLLPEQHHTTHDSLTSTFVLEDVKLEVRQTSRKKVLEVPGYDYNNPNDKLNYCPPALNGNNYDDDNDNVGGFEGGADDDYNNNTLTQDPNNQDHNPDAKSCQIFGDDNDFVGVDDDDDDILTGSRLLPEPGEVMNLKIDYAKIAKNVDVKVMKETMIRRMEKETNKKPNQQIELSRLYWKVRIDLPQKEADDFSVAMAVSCLLQIANEKSLCLETQKDFDDVLITTNVED